jgi:hypothetical protein
MNSGCKDFDYTFSYTTELDDATLLTKSIVALDLCWLLEKSNSKIREIGKVRLAKVELHIWASRVRAIIFLKIALMQFY